MTLLPPTPDPTPRPFFWGWDDEHTPGADASHAARQVAPSPHAASASLGTGHTQVLPALPDVSVPAASGSVQRSGSARRPSVRSVLVHLLGVLLLAGLGSLSGASWRALVLPEHSTPALVARHIGRPPAAVPTPLASLQPPATPSSGAGMAPTPVPPAPTPRPAQNSSVPPSPVLAQDTFGRPDQPWWGTASNGLLWSGDANTSPVFAIRTGTGQIRGGTGFFTALLGPAVDSVQVTATGSVSHFSQAGAVNLGVVVHWHNASNYEKAYLDGRALVVMQRVAGVMTILGQALFAAQDGRSYTLQLVAVGSRLLARAWPTGTREPANWLVQVSASSLASGRAGIRVLMQPWCLITITSFQEQRVSEQTAEEGA